MKRLNFVIFFLSSICLFAQTDTRNLEAFSSMSVNAGIEVYLFNSDTPKAVIETSYTDTDKIVTKVSGDHLSIRWEKTGYSVKNRKAVVNLYFTELESVSASSGAYIESSECIKSKDFDVSCSSGAVIKIDVEVDNIKVDVSSGASVKISGSATNQEADASSGASYRAGELITLNTYAEASSGAFMKVFASKFFEGSASSGGAVRYGGDPEDTDINVGKYSGGSVRKL